MIHFVHFFHLLCITAQVMTKNAAFVSVANLLCREPSRKCNDAAPRNNLSGVLILSSA